jgi:rhamnulokinase
VKKYIAVDLGASNGRVIVGNLEKFEVTNRFVTRNELINGSVFWDIVYIYSEIKKGLKKAFSLYGDEIASIGIDTWGVDYGLLDETGELIGMPYHYRDDRTDGIMDEVFSVVPQEDVYKATGIQLMQINTIYQLAAMKKKHPEMLSAARCYLSIPDLLHYWLTGIKRNEFSHATTTQLYNPTRRDWAWNIIDALGLDRKLFGTLVPSGTVLGNLKPDVAEELGALEGVAVIASGSHDTASSVAAVPAEKGEEYLYISSGTWSLLGTETPEPVISPKTLEYNFTNEGAASGKFRLLKNIMGMWIQQECLRSWESKGQTIGFKELDALTLDEEDFPAFIDPNDDRFLKPNSSGSPMPDRICAYCREHGMEEPKNYGQYMAVIYRGLAKAYAHYIKQLEEVSGRSFNKLYIIGGGSKNSILNAWTAQEAGIRVSAGPVEATALGNMLVQALSMGDIASRSEGRALIRKYQQITDFFA